MTTEKEVQKAYYRVNRKKFKIARDKWKEAVGWKEYMRKYR